MALIFPPIDSSQKEYKDIEMKKKKKGKDI